jgi:hypothetical protein
MKKKQWAPRHRYTSEEKEFLKKIVKGRSYKEITTLFNECFGADLTFSQIEGAMDYLGLHNGKHRHYTPDNIQFLKENITGRCYAELTKLFNEHFGLTVSQKKITHICDFYGLYNRRKDAQNRPIGSERLNRNGYVDVKIAFPSVWKPKHYVVWEKEYGKIPNGYMLMFADSNRSNCSLDNLLQVSYQELSRMNRFGLISSDPELTKASLLFVRLKLLINKRVRELKEKGIKV